MTNVWGFLLQTLSVSAVALVLLIIKRLFLDKISPNVQYALWLVLSFSIPAVEVVIAVVSLYFHYHLMTNLGDLADHLNLPERDRLYGTRIWQAALTTLLGVPMLKSLCVQTGLLVAAFIVLVRVVVGIIYLEGSLRELAEQSSLS